MSSPPAKRQRTEDAPITRSATWYTDGSIVLQAQHTQFRVHWGVLAQHSSFFRDMQDLPQPPDQPSVDGCPLVELLLDSAEDVGHLLRVLYDPTFLHEATSLPFAVVAALIRLGRKYHFQNLLDSALRILTLDHPTTFEEFEAHKQSIIMSDPGIAFDIITLARENNVLRVLPYAYYRAVIRHTQLFDGISRGDGTLAFLAPIDQRRCVLGREQLVTKQFQSGYPLGWLRKWNYGHDCTDSVQCAEDRDSRLRYYLEVVKLRVLSRYLEGTACAACERHTEQSMTAGQKKIWDEFPSIFGLLPWDELENDL
ncbi:hypothetical protein C8R43DRAFT_910758 [Mycena crocata]|nr:hypothetical protein C8R43DRAFT_910758 [Mycena crocata]